MDIRQKYLYRIPKIQSKELKKLNKCPIEEASVLLGREKNRITSGKGGRKTKVHIALQRKHDMESEGGGSSGGRGETDLVLGEGKRLKP